MNERINKKKWVAVCVLIVLGIMGIFAGCGDGTDSKVKEFADTNGISVEFAEDIFTIAEEIGMNIEDLEVSSASDDDIVAEYWDYKIHIVGNGGKVASVSSTVGVFYGDGEVENKIPDLFLTHDEWTHIMSAAQIDVEELLKSPNSAKHPERSEYDIVRDGHKYDVTSYVDAENSLGAQVRTYYKATYKWDGDTDKVPELRKIDVIDK